MKEDIDRGEMVAEMEPMRLDGAFPHRETLNDLALELAAAAEGFKRSLPEGIRASLAETVRAMNCYYSNLIEGHPTHPVDIERALRNDFSHDPKARDLQLEAVAHIDVQKWIDEGGVRARTSSVEAMRDIHRRFCERLPPDLLWVTDPDTGHHETVHPGELRSTDVRVGRHLAVSPGAVPRFLTRFEEAYSGLGKTEAILATAASHHRLLWIHPFVDGNGRVARLMSHAMLLDSGGLWSIARGLARNVVDYKRLLANCDLVRRNDLDGRGALSEQALGSFTRFFLETCIGQVRFMEELVQPERLRSRILAWAAEETGKGTLPPRVGEILSAVLYHGELPRADAAGLLGTTPRHARRLVSSLIDRGALRSDGPRASLKLAFPAELVPEWMPGLFPGKSG